MIRDPLLALLALVAAAHAAPAKANEFAPALRDLAESRLSAIAADPKVIEALRARADEPDPTQAEIDRLDEEWMAQLGSASTPLIDEIASRPASAALAEHRDAAGGLLTEIFVMGPAGLNVAMSDTTSDYWQGDEAKFRRTYPEGAGAVHVSGVELDQSTQTYQSQVSMTVADPDSGAPLGAITFGVNVELLP